MEEQWGDDLVSNRQFDAAINHYIEAGKTLKALDVAIQDKQWKKAVEIIQVNLNLMSIFIPPVKTSKMYIQNCIYDFCAEGEQFFPFLMGSCM